MAHGDVKELAMCSTQDPSGGTAGGGWMSGGFLPSFLLPHLPSETHSAHSTQPEMDFAQGAELCSGFFSIFLKVPATYPTARAFGKYHLVSKP